MRKLASLLLVLFALPLFASTYGTIIIRDGDHQYVDGHTDEIGVAGLGRHYVYFTRDGVAYAIDDDKTLAQIRKIVKPQADLGEQQAKLGAEQAALGAKQAALGAKQASAGSSARQRELGEQQRELGRQQRVLGEQQRILGEKQREAGRAARRQYEKLFDDAIRSGVAKRR